MDLKSLPEEAKFVWRVGNVITWLILCSLLATASFFLRNEIPIPQIVILYTVISLVVLYLIMTLSLPIFRWRRYRYAVSNDFIEMQKGVFFLKYTILPIKRVQHIVVKEGPILRSKGVASLSIHTAATTHSIPVLKKDEAIELRNLIAEFAKLNEDHV